MVIRKKPTGDRKQQVNQAMQSGLPVETHKKFAAGTNKQHTGPANAKKLDNFTFGEDEELVVKTVDKSVAMAIQQARQAKGWTQKELAARINEKPSVVNDYEAGRVVPNQQILAKLERNLGVKLRGQNIGAPLGK